MERVCAKLPTEALLTLIGVAITALLAFAGTAFTAYMQYKSSKAKAKKDAEEADAQKAKKAEEELEAQNKRIYEESIQRQFQELGAKIDSVSNGMTAINQRLDMQKKQFDNRIFEVEESIQMIIQVLSKNAREFSSLLKLQGQTESRMQVLMDLEMQNLRFSKELSSILDKVADVLNRSINDEEIAKKIQEIVAESGSIDRDLVETIISSQRAIFKQSGTATATVVEKTPETKFGSKFSFSSEGDQ